MRIGEITQIGERQVPSWTPLKPEKPLVKQEPERVYELEIEEYEDTK